MSTDGNVKSKSERPDKEDYIGDNAKNNHISLQHLMNMDIDFNIRDYLDLSNMTEAEVDRCKFWVSANRIVRQSGDYNYKKEKILVNSNWNIQLLEEKLRNYHGKELLGFIKYGWPLNAEKVKQNEIICQGIVIP